MKRPLATAAALLVGALPLAAAPPEVEPLQPLETARAAEPVVAGEPAETAGELLSILDCDRFRPRTAVITLRWKRALQGAPQRLDVNGIAGGFASGRFVATRDLPAARTTAAVEQLEPGRSYQWRVLTRTGAGWVASKVDEFLVPVCTADEASEQEEQ
jgi:hypothetical protein